MKIAILSDIHSNYFALKSVINDFDKYNVNKIFILGDVFGYYPWALETFNLLEPFLKNSKCIKGNHDDLLLQEVTPNPEPSYWKAAKLNEEQLINNCQNAIEWLKSLPISESFTMREYQIKLFHGTPDNPLFGRYYPSDFSNYDWFPKRNEILLLGHTHYPIKKILKNNSIIFNPGSVGQPRDGNPMPSWGLLDTETVKFNHVRTNYNNIYVMDILKNMEWDTRAILALNKNYSGDL